MTKLRAVLICVLVGVLALLGFQRHSSHLDAVRANDMASKWRGRPRLLLMRPNAIMRPNAQVEGQFSDLALISAVPQAYPRPPSEWSANEKQFYERILTGSRYDVLVVPMQVNG